MWESRSHSRFFDALYGTVCGVLSALSIRSHVSDSLNTSTPGIVVSTICDCGTKSAVVYALVAMMGTVLCAT